jgi:predicted nuclease with TOPRIM domain
MNEDPTKKFSDGESFEARVLSGLAAIQVGQVEIRNQQIEILNEQVEIRREQAEMRAELAEMKKAIAALDSRLSSVEQRLSSLEEKVDARLRETRPIWESVLDNVKRLDLKFDEVLSELFDVKADSKRHERLILQLEKLR